MCYSDELCRDPSNPCDGVVCPEDEVCYEGSCYRDCSDGACLNDGFCRVAPEDYCGSNAPFCPSGESCALGSCFSVTDCNDSRDCPDGTACYLDGTCRADACAGTLCFAGTVCDGGRCYTPGCVTDANCEGGTVCYPDGLCRGKPFFSDGSCRADACAAVVCGPGQSCLDGTCVVQNGCTTDADCPALFECYTDGVCRRDPPCLSQSCAPGDACRENVCLPTCTGDGDCSTGESCFDGVCRLSQCDGVPCLAETEVCNGGVCRRTCVDANDCTGNDACIDGVCAEGCGGEVCAVGEVCLNDRCTEGCDSTTCTSPDASCVEESCASELVCIDFPSGDGATAGSDPALVQGSWLIARLQPCISGFSEALGTVNLTQAQASDTPTGTFDWIDPAETGSVQTVTYASPTFSTNWFLGGFQYGLSQCSRIVDHIHQCRFLDGSVAEVYDVRIYRQ